jgi:hypothetical protein
MFCQPGFEYFQRNLPNSPYNYLEIGVFNGDSIAALARNNPNKTIYGVDPFLEDGYTTHTTGVNRHEFMPEQQRNTLNNIEGLSNVTLFEMTSESFAAVLTDELVADMNVAWVLIDGSHHYADVQIDVDLALRLIGDRPGGIVFDDLNLPDVDRARRYFIDKYGSQTDHAVDLPGPHPGHIMAYSVNARTAQH